MTDADDTQDIMLGELFAGRYEIRERLGLGGMAVVYAGFDRMLQRDVAVKILRTDVRDATARRRLAREAQAAGRLHHRHIITFHDVGDTDGRVFIVMERLIGRTLADERAAVGQMSGLRVAGIGAQIASALRVVHGAGIVHRDLKPENVFLLDSATGDFCKLLDFSIAKLPEALTDGVLTQTGTVFGTPRYMPPEQAVGDAVSAQTDLYALGAVMFELMVGRPPFVAANAIKLLTLQSTQPAPRLAACGVRVPEAMDDLVNAMLAKEPRERPASALDVQRALEQVVLRGDPGPAVRPPTRGKARSKKLAGIADTTQVGNENATTTGGTVRAPSAVYRAVDHSADPAVGSDRKTQPRPRLDPGSSPRVAAGVVGEAKPVAAEGAKRTRRSTTPRTTGTTGRGRSKRATMPSWSKTDGAPRGSYRGHGPVDDERTTVDEDE